MNKGVISAENAGEVSLSYDHQTTAEPDAGHWNKTDYGLEFARLAKQIGGGVMYVGAGPAFPPGGFGGLAFF